MSSCNKSVYAFVPSQQCWSLSAFIPAKYDFKLNINAFTKINACYADIPICFSSPVYYLPAQASLLVDDLNNSSFNAVLSGNYIVIDDSSFNFANSLYSQYFSAFNATTSAYQIQYIQKYLSPLGEIIYFNKTTNEQYLSIQSNWLSSDCMLQDASFTTLYSYFSSVSALARLNQTTIVDLSAYASNKFNILSLCCDTHTDQILELSGCCQLERQSAELYRDSGAGMPTDPSLWLKTEVGTEYDNSTGQWTAAVGANGTQSTSGKRPSAITTVSTLYGRNAIPFGSGKNLTFSTPSTWRTILFVATRTSAAGYGLMAGNDITPGVLSMPNPGLLITSTDVGGIAGVGGPRWSFGGNTYNPLAAQWLNRPHVYGFQWREITSDTQVTSVGNKRLYLSMWVDGQRHVFNLTLTSATSIPSSIALTKLGTTPSLSASDTSYYFDGSISEVIGWDRDLTDNEVLIAQQYLLQKYGISEPAKNPQILAVGDSITAGSNGPSWINSIWAAKYVADTQYDWIGKIMEAVGGRTAQLALANINLYKPMVLPGQFVAVFLGTNDLDIGRTVAQLKADIRDICDEYTSVGARVVVCTMLPRTGASGNWTEAKRTEFNDWLRATWRVFSVGLADFAADSRFTTHSGTYFVDGAHPNQAGADALAEIFVSAIPI